MNKKKILLYSTLGLLTVTLVTAVLVNYLSNTTQVDMSVSSPMSVSEITGDDLSGILGGETATVEFDIRNLANVDINGIMEITISNAGISVDDFNSIYTEITEGSWSSGSFNALEVGGFIDSVTDNGDEVVILSTLQPWQTGKGAWHVKSDISFKPEALGDYSVSVRMIPA